MVGQPAVFLDRDGVLNRSQVVDGKPYAPRKLEDFHLLPGVERAVLDLKKAGYFIAVVTNQPDIGNGLVEIGVVEAMHQRLRDMLAVDAIYYCPHAQNAGCACRKPLPGMLLQAQKDYKKLDLKRSWMVGDRAGDIAAGQAAGCRTIFIDRNYREPRPDTATAIVKSLPAAVSIILATREGTHAEHT